MAITMFGPRPAQSTATRHDADPGGAYLAVDSGPGIERPKIP
jgi:hypothetical protein